MSASQETGNKAAFRRFHDAADTGDGDVIARTIDELVAPDVRIRTPLMETTGRQALKDVWTALLRAFPDIHVEVEHMVAEGDEVVGRSKVTGTHRGDFMGVPATGTPVTYHEAFFFRFADGVVTDVWGIVDVFTVMRQLGMVPARP